MILQIGSQIAAYRKQLGMTQEQLANELGVSNQAVSKWESDQSCPDIQLLPQLADLFHISLDTLFGRATPTQNEATLPWGDDGDLRAVLYIGRTLQKYRKFDRQNRSNEVVELHFAGEVRDIHSDFSVVCKDSIIHGNVTAGDSVTCETVEGNVTAGDGVTCETVEGNVTAGDGVSCGSVGGNIHAGDEVRCGDVQGSIFAEDSVYCGNVGGHVQAGDTIKCGEIHGDAEAGGKIFIQK